MTLNGDTLMANAGRDEARAEIPLSALALRPTGNEITITARPFEQWGDRENTREVHPATWMVTFDAAISVSEKDKKNKGSFRPHNYLH